jgi:rhamnogalacturonyl hydrolase YesR
MTRQQSTPTIATWAAVLACNLLGLVGACQKSNVGSDAGSPPDRAVASGGKNTSVGTGGSAGSSATSKTSTGGTAGADSALTGGTIGTGGNQSGKGGSGEGGAVGSGGAGTTQTSTGATGGTTAIATSTVDAGTGAVTSTGGGPGTGGATSTPTRTGGVPGTGGNTSGTGGAGGAVAGLPTTSDLVALLKKVIPYEIQLGPEDPSWVNKWTEATFYIGVMSAYLATGDAELLTDATNWSTKNKWTLLGSPTRNADNQCAGQVYADIYLTNPVSTNATMIANLKTNIDAMVASPKPGIVKADGHDWWWCDALFMAPGAVARLGKISGDAKYYTFLDTMWSATQAGLFDSKTGLFWRDSTFVNGNVYWSRGNGWVMAGLVRVLQALPDGGAGHDDYVQLLKTMAAAIVPYQQDDGTWHADLTHPTKYANPETSGTGLITYALAYGINQGLLDKATYLPVVAKAWKALASAVDGQGRVGYIQATGSAPAAATATETHDYGVGAWVLAATELYLMVK